jgi:membrane-bound serine protease (ClpP class)
VHGERRIARTAVGAVLVVTSLATGARAQDPDGPVVRLSLEGVVDPFVADHLTRELRAADDASAVLLVIDTPGGLDSSMREIVKAIKGAPVPVLCYVGPRGARAASAGAFILLACHVAAMAPATNVGASTPVGIGGVTLSRKVEEDAAATIRGLAEDTGRNADLAETFVTESRSITAEEALEGDVIDVIAPTERALLEDADGRDVAVADGTTVTVRTAGAAIEERSMSPGIGLLHAMFDPNLAFIFFWLGLALIVLELIVPGHVFSGTVGTILLILSVVSFGLLPVRLIGLVLLAASIVFFVLELKVPGLGVWSAAGIVALVLGGLFLFDPAGGVRVSPFAIAPVAASMALFFGFVVSKALAMRHLPPAQGAEAIVGREGVVLGSGLHPEGVVRVAAEEWKATSSAGDLPAGARIRATRLDGLVLTVEPVASEHATTGGTAAPAGGSRETRRQSGGGS